jgi:CheY-like chemotaxis protein
MSAGPSPRSVLVVDDDELIREITVLTLRRLGGYDVREAASGPEGLAAAVGDVPDAILLDVMMPGMDGKQTFSRLREDPRTADVPVVFLTATLLTPEREELERSGARGVIAKPFDPMALVAELQRLLDW